MTKKLTFEAAQRFLVDVPLDKFFYINKGPIIKNVGELAEYLKIIPDEIFIYHRNNTKNDFYNWILFVVGDVKLANEIAHAKTKNTTYKRVVARISFLKSIKKGAEKNDN